MKHIFLVLGGYGHLTDLGMQSGISKQQVVRCASLRVSVHQCQSAPNMIIAGKTTHITCYIKMRVNIPELWHIKHCVQHTDIFRIAADICVY